jgi:hypothetical protein
MRMTGIPPKRQPSIGHGWPTSAHSRSLCTLIMTDIDCRSRVDVREDFLDGALGQRDKPWVRLGVVRMIMAAWWSAKPRARFHLRSSTRGHRGTLTQSGRFINHETATARFWRCMNMSKPEDATSWRAGSQVRSASTASIRKRAAATNSGRLFR